MEEKRSVSMSSSGTGEKRPVSMSFSGTGEKRPVSMSDSGRGREIGTALLGWYRLRGRSLPWREDSSPYHVWVSEIMLQQTRVEAVRGYYLRFMERFPDVEVLAAADVDECLKLWEGLGYYSRARNLHRAAARIVKEHGGRFPSSSDSLRSLPGIGPYTAAAIASIAFGERIPAVDGNLLRVFARLSLYEGQIRGRGALPAASAFFQDVMDSLPSENPGDINQALMDLGALLCVPGGAPACGECPLRALCGAFSEGRCAQLPVMPSKKERRIEKRTVLVIRDENRIVLRRRPPSGLLADMYEFPNEEGWLTKKQALDRARQYGFSPVRILPLPEAKHVFTHLEWRLRGYEIRMGSFPGEERGPCADQEPAVCSGQKAAGFQAAKRELPAGNCFVTTISKMKKEYAVPNAFDSFRACL